MPDGIGAQVCLFGYLYGAMHTCFFLRFQKNLRTPIETETPVSQPSYRVYKDCTRDHTPFSTHIYVHVYVYMSACRSTCMSVCACVYVRACVCTRECMYIYACKCVNILRVYVDEQELCTASTEGDVSRMRMLLLSCGVDPDEGDYDSRSPLRTSICDMIHPYVT